MTVSHSPIKIDYRALLWITAPPLLVLAGYFIRKWYQARRLRLYGIGKGAPGFQTNVARIRVTPEIAARLRRGEQVSSEEIAQAAARVERDNNRGARSDTNAEKKSDSEAVNEWLPDAVAKPKKRGKARRK